MKVNGIPVLHFWLLFDSAVATNRIMKRIRRDDPELIRRYERNPISPEDMRAKRIKQWRETVVDGQPGADQECGP